MISAEYKRGSIEDPTWDEIDPDPKLGGFKPQPIRRQGPRAVQQNVEAPRVQNGSCETGVDVGVLSHPRREKALTGLHRAAEHSYHRTSVPRACRAHSTANASDPAIRDTQGPSFGDALSGTVRTESIFGCGVGTTGVYGLTTLAVADRGARLMGMRASSTASGVDGNVGQRGFGASR